MCLSRFITTHDLVDGRREWKRHSEKLKFSIKYFISTCEQISSFPRKEEILIGKLHELLNKI